MSQQDERFCFIVEWYDRNASFYRKYQFIFYPKDNTIEMFDPKNHRIFLSRSKADNIRLEDLYIGSTVNVLSRQLKVSDYGDTYTRSKLNSKKERTLGMIKPDAISNLGKIIDEIYHTGFNITRLKMCRLSRNEALDFYQEHQSKPFFNSLVDFISSGPVVAFELMGEGAVSRWREVLGPTNTTEAKSVAPTSIRAQFGSDGTKNACHGSDSAGSAGREVEFFFPCSGPGRKNTATFSDCTCCIIKPHAVKEGIAGQIITTIQKMGFEISALQMFNLEQANAEEFLEVYKGVVQEYPSMVKEMTLGPCIALEIRAQDAVRTFREFVGPADPQIAQHLRPRTLRAQFGKEKVQNAVHCTDLPEDGILEVKYFFEILDQ